MEKQFENANFPRFCEEYNVFDEFLLIKPLSKLVW